MRIILNVTLGMAWLCIAGVASANLIANGNFENSTSENINGAEFTFGLNDPQEWYVLQGGAEN